MEENIMDTNRENVASLEEKEKIKKQMIIYNNEKGT